MLSPARAGRCLGVLARAGRYLGTACACTGHCLVAACALPRGGACVRALGCALEVPARGLGCARTRWALPGRPRLGCARAVALPACWLFVRPPLVARRPPAKAQGHRPSDHRPQATGLMRVRACLWYIGHPPSNLNKIPPFATRKTLKHNNQKYHPSPYIP